MFQWANYQFITAYCNFTALLTTKGGSQANVIELNFTFIVYFVRGSLGC
jgi:hypothetical protein